MTRNDSISLTVGRLLWQSERQKSHREAFSDSQQRVRTASLNASGAMMSMIPMLVCLGRLGSAIAQALTIEGFHFAGQSTLLPSSGWFKFGRRSSRVGGGLLATPRSQLSGPGVKQVVPLGPCGRLLDLFHLTSMCLGGRWEGRSTSKRQGTARATRQGPGRRLHHP